MRSQAWIGVVAGGALVVLAAAVAFGESDQARRLADHAEQLAASERVLAAAATTRSNLGVSVVLERTSDLDPSLMSGAAEAGAVTVEAARRLLMEVDALDQMSNEVRLVDNSAAIGSALESFRSAESGADVEAAAVEAISGLDDLESEVVEFRDVTAGVVRAEGGRAGALSRTASYVVGLVGPATALFGYRRLARNRLERIRREEALRRREEIAAAKVDLVAGISHELRTPLTGIHGFASTLVEMLDGREDPADRPLMREVAETVVDQAGDLSRMVDDLIAYMRLSDGTLSAKPVPVAVGGAVRTVIDEFSGQATIELDVEPADVVVDPIHLRQILRNLVSNAVKHGGPRIRLDGRVVASEYRLVVADDGAGIDPSRSDPFAAFAHDGTAPLSVGSIGMGLGVVKGLMDLSGAEVAYDRRDGSTVFELSLPIGAHDDQRNDALAAPPAEL